jgi:cob(I)alamin adenosyltransferase
MEADNKARNGLLILNTGHGKGKTTAALGMVLRAWGRGFRICVIQFIKSETANYGETRAAGKLGIEWYALGTGCTFDREETPNDIEMAVKAWDLAREKISSRAYDLIVLDEFTYPLKFGWLDTDQVLAWLKTNRPHDLHLIITGRDAPQPLAEMADLVTEMRKVKHPFDQGIKGQPGIEF